MSSLAERVGPRLPPLLALGLCLVLATTVGAAAPRYPLAAVGVAVIVLAVGVSALRPMTLPLLALPALLIVLRIGGGGVDLSVSDAALATATVPALVLGLRPYSPEMRSILWLTVLYQMATLFTVIANPYTANALEWAHTWLLTGGALAVGWGVGRAGMARTGIWLIFATACLMSLTVVVQFGVNVSHGSFEPVYVEWPFTMHKNFTGCTLGIVAAVAYAAPPWLVPDRRQALIVFWWCVLGVCLSQAGQAIVALAVVLVVIVLRSYQGRRRSMLIMLAVVPAVWAVVIATRDELASGNQHNSVAQRLTWYQEAMDIWRTDPIVGVGLRWWYTDRFPVRFQPPNAELEVLTSAGVVGLVGFIVFMGGTLLVLWRLGPTYGGAAFAAVLSRVTQGQFDLFWVAVQISLAFAVTGLCLGAKSWLEDETSASAPVKERVAG